jgi:TolB protein
MTPRWSPDGQAIVFDDSDSIYLMKADGSQLRTLATNPPIVSASSSTWSPDGSKIAFFGLGSKLIDNSLFVVDADGSHLRRLAAASFFAHRVAWSPDGLSIAFVSGGGGDPNSTLGQDIVIAVIGVDGKGFRKLSAENESAYDPVWSPAGAEIAFFTGQGKDAQVRVVNADGGGERQLARGFEPAWSPDGKRIAFVRARGRDPHGNDAIGAYYEIWIMGTDGRDQRRLTKGRHDGFYGTTAWSPDGTQLAFMRQRKLFSARFIWTLDVASARARRLTVG